MDLKREAARAAAELITNQEQIGLGEGSTIAFLVTELKQRAAAGGKIFYSSSDKTKRLLSEAGFKTENSSHTAAIDVYFDGCDQLDHSLNALKSGAGIHTMEKLLAVMAKEFVLLADESKFVPTFDGRFPLVIELIPEALLFVTAAIGRLAPEAKITRREQHGSLLLTRHGNVLIDCWLTGRGDLKEIASLARSLPGVLDTSLFTAIAKRAVIAGNDGTRIVHPVTA